MMLGKMCFLMTTLILGRRFEADWKKLATRSVKKIFMLNSPEAIEKATDEMGEIKAVIKARYRIVLSTFNFFSTYAPSNIHPISPFHHGRNIFDQRKSCHQGTSLNAKLSRLYSNLQT